MRRGRGFQYLRATGAGVSVTDRERIEALAIPPAWHDVWVCSDPLGHIQAVGIDEAGRTQYVYHPDWTARRARRKFERSLALAAALPTARKAVTLDLRAEGLGRERILAAAFRILDLAAPRIGSSRALAGTRGLTTLQGADADIDGSTVTLAFLGKGGQRQHLELRDDDLASALAEMRRGGRRRLLAFQRGRERVPLTPESVNAYIAEVTGGRFSAKDFRTLRGTIVAAQTLAAEPSPNECVRRGSPTRRSRRSREAAERRAVHACAVALGNTDAVARRSYIDPRVFDQFRRGSTLDGAVSPDRAIRHLLHSETLTT